MNTQTIEYDVDYDGEVSEELQNMGSYNHSYLQAKIAALFFNTDNYVPLTELSLDVSKLQSGELAGKVKETIKPDVCIYPRREINLARDILKMSEMPLAAIEILSPLQGVQTIIDKFQIYFELGIRSCWLVYPSAATVAVYTSVDEFKVFSSGKITDDVLKTEIPIANIFS